ncbi:hypothetical protein GCM10009113_18960 [Marinobacter szutsaonensis]
MGAAVAGKIEQALGQGDGILILLVCGLLWTAWVLVAHGDLGLRWLGMAMVKRGVRPRLLIWTEGRYHC